MSCCAPSVTSCIWPYWTKAGATDLNSKTNKPSLTFLFHHNLPLLCSVAHTEAALESFASTVRSFYTNDSLSHKHARPASNWWYVRLTENAGNQRCCSWLVDHYISSKKNETDKQLWQQQSGARLRLLARKSRLSLTLVCARHHLQTEAEPTSREGKTLFRSWKHLFRTETRTTRPETGGD